MENTLLDKPVLAMYDVRGIQSFIFRTNKVKEIIGASLIVENIIQDALEYAVSKGFEGKTINHILKWDRNEELKFLSDTSVDIQILFVGGGNAYVLYRNRELAVHVNKLMSRYVLEETYSLQLAVALVDKTDSYEEDYKSVQLRMSEIKACMPYSGCLGALPIVEVDDMSGFPITAEKIEGRIHDIEASSGLSKERLLKLKQYFVKYQNKSDVGEKRHGKLITEYGKDSTIAVVHIDGNNMGMRIRDLLQEVKDYSEAVKRMREISLNINDGFKESFASMVGKIQTWVGNDKKYIRKIIVAGDDITFVCNGKLALAAVEAFVDDVTKKVMFGDDTNSENVKKYGMSVCAGIAYVHSHFPFSTAYQVAEACCDSAKTRAKQDANKEGDRIGNWVDFQICKDVQNVDLEKNREKDYRVASDEWLLRRPYYMATHRENNEYFHMNNMNESYSFEKFKDSYAYFTDEDKMPSALAKKFRNTYPLGRDAIEELVIFAKSRKKLGDEPAYIKDSDNEYVAAWYDALEMMDMYIDIEKGGK